MKKTIFFPLTVFISTSVESFSTNKIPGVLFQPEISSGTQSSFENTCNTLQLHQEAETQFVSMPKNEKTKFYISFGSILQALLVVFALSFPANADVDISNGAALFAGNCAGCHAGGMNYVKEQKNLKQEALERYVSSTLNRDDVKSWVMNSGQHQRLVFFKAPSGNGKLTESEYADVTAYIVDQASGEKWDR